LKARITQSALRDCEEILNWFDAQGNRAAGSALVSQLLERIEQLERFPQSGRIVPEFQQSELRELIEPPFRLVYRLTKHDLTVIRIWRGERQLKLPG
jgi:plasmid stabilization system protein ParE